MRSIAILSLVLLASVACNLSTSSDTGVLTPEPSSVVEVAESKPENNQEEVQTQVQQVSTKPEQTTTGTSCVPRNDWPLYSVIPGDTLGSIAQRANTTFNQLAQANCLSNVDQISVGQQLRVPTVPVAVPPPISNPQSDNRSYRDTNTSLAFDYPSSWYVTSLAAGVQLTSYELGNLPSRAAWTDAMP